MNELPHRLNARPTTQAAEGLPRLRWTLADFERLTKLGVFTEDDRIELVGGELVPMSPKGNRHENLKALLADAMYRRLPDALLLTTDIGWCPDHDTYLEPDILVYRRVPEPSRVPAAEVLLAIEIAVSSLAYDTGRKAEIYASLGVPDYWVLNAVTLTARLHRGPSGGKFTSVVELAPGDTLVPHLVPSLAVSLAALGLV